MCRTLPDNELYHVSPFISAEYQVMAERITDSQTNLDIGKDIAPSYISPVPATTIGEVEVMKTYARYCRSYQDEKVTNPLTMIDRRCPIAVFVPSGFRILALEIPANCQAV
jgi:hypothetical protein